VRNPQKRAINRQLPGSAREAAAWLRSVYAFAWLKLRRTRFARRSGVAAPRVARQGEAWRPGLDLNQDKERCIALASTLFRHRAASIYPQHRLLGHSLPRLTLLAGYTRTPAGSAPGRHAESDCRATKVIRHELWPMLTPTREAVNPLCASLAIMSASL